MTDKDITIRSYRESHLRKGKGYSYHKAFSDDPYRNMVWQFEKNNLDSIIATFYGNVEIHHLDFACGTGRILSYLENRTKSAIGVDISSEMLDVARKNNRNAEIIEADLTRKDVLGDRKFNLITAFRFFPNAEESLRMEAMQTISRHLTNDGYLVFNNHKNTGSTRNRLARFLGRLGYKGLPYYRGMSIPELKALLLVNHLEIVKIYSFCVFPASEKHKLLPMFLLRAVESALSKFYPLRNFGENLIIVCKRSVNQLNMKGKLVEESMLSFLGDVYLDRAYKLGIGFKNVVLNMEHPISRNGKPEKHKVNLLARSSFYREVFNCNVIVNLANNHIVDYGQEAYLNTLKSLDKDNIKYFGSGNQYNNCNNPLIFEIEGKWIALFGYALNECNPVYFKNGLYGAASLDINKFIIDIDIVRKKVDFIVVNIHWGEEEIAFPSYSNRLLAHQLIDVGVDLIIGHHPHVIQPVELYKDKYIFYSLGNFIFSDLEVKSYFDDKMVFKTFKKKQSRTNKIGLVVNLDKKFNLTYYTIYFNGSSVIKLDFPIPKFLPQNNIAYQLLFLFYSRLNMLKDFIKNPRRISFRNIKNFLRRKR